MSHTYSRRVHFADTDAAGVVHFSRMLCYVEEAEHEWLERCGIPLQGEGGWPRVHVECRYSAPLRVGDTAEVMIASTHVGNSSIRWEFQIVCHQKTVAQGEMKTVYVNGQGKATQIDDAWRAALQPGD